MTPSLLHSFTLTHSLTHSLKVNWRPFLWPPACRPTCVHCSCHYCLLADELSCASRRDEAAVRHLSLASDARRGKHTEHRTDETTSQLANQLANQPTSQSARQPERERENNQPTTNCCTAPKLRRNCVIRVRLHHCTSYCCCFCFFYRLDSTVLADVLGGSLPVGRQAPGSPRSSVRHLSRIFVPLSFAACLPLSPHRRSLTANPARQRQRRPPPPPPSFAL